LRLWEQDKDISSDGARAYVLKRLVRWMEVDVERKWRWGEYWGFGGLVAWLHGLDGVIERWGVERREKDRGSGDGVGEELGVVRRG